VQSKEDKRVFYVELSDKGKQILNGDREIYKWVTDSITDIAKDERELQIVGKVMQELVTRLERKRG
jgi:DNA-binding MarR family transcriptional regulator